MTLDVLAIGAVPLHALQMPQVGRYGLTQAAGYQDRAVRLQSEAHDLDRVGFGCEAGSLLPAAHAGGIEAQQQVSAVAGQLIGKRPDELFTLLLGREEAAFQAAFHIPARLEFFDLGRSVVSYDIHGDSSSTRVSGQS